MITVKKISYLLIILSSLYSCAVKEDEQEQVSDVNVRTQVTDNDIDGDLLVGENDKKPKRANVPTVQLSITELNKLSFDYIESEKFLEFKGKQNDSLDLNIQNISNYFIINQFAKTKQFTLLPDASIYPEGVMADLFSNDLIVVNRESLYSEAKDPEFRDLSGKFSFKLKITVNDIEKKEELRDFSFKLYFLDKNNIKTHIKTFKLSDFSGAVLSENANELIVAIDLDEIPPRKILNTMFSVGAKAWIEIDDYTLIRNAEKIKYSTLIKNIRNKCAEVIVTSDGSTERIFLSDYEKNLEKTLRLLYEDTKFTNSKLSSFAGKNSNLHILNDWRDLPDGLGSWIVASNKISANEKTTVKAGDTYILSYVDSYDLKNQSDSEHMIYMSDFSGKYDIWKIANVKELKSISIYAIPISETGYKMQDYTRSSTLGSGRGAHPFRGQFLFKYKTSDREELEANIKSEIKVLIDDEVVDVSFIDYKITDSYKGYKTSFSFDEYLRPTKISFSNKYIAVSNWRGFRYFFQQDTYQLSSDHGHKDALRSPDTEDYKDQKINLYIFYKY